eukprot:8700105-Pyramimonas_sp.AAC.1
MRACGPRRLSRTHPLEAMATLPPRSPRRSSPRCGGWNMLCPTETASPTIGRCTAAGRAPLVSPAPPRPVASAPPRRHHGA